MMGTNYSPSSRWAGHLTLALIALILIFPHVVMAVTSLKSLKEVYTLPLSFFPRILHPENYIQMWFALPLSDYFRSSLIIATGATTLALVLTIPAAYAVARMRFKGHLALLFTALTFQMFGPITIIVGLFKVMNNYRLIDTYLALILINAAFNCPLMLWLLQAYLRGIPISMDESAKIDGASDLRIITSIIVPQLKPAILVAGSMTFVNSWNEYLSALTFISTPFKKPLPVGLTGFVGRYQINWHYLMGGSLVSTIPVAIVFFFCMKYMIGGLMIGSSK